MTDADDAYANAPYIADGAAYPDRWADAAAAFRAEVPGQSVPYGPSSRQYVTTFAPDTPKGTVVFVHGGYWRQTDPSMWSHLARGVVAAGWACAMPGYDLCPSVRIAGITQQIAQAVMSIADASEGPLILAGHSAGAHLVARMCAPGMLHADVVARVVKVVPISPLSDLTPLLDTSMNADFGMDTGMAQAESPVHQPAPAVPVDIWVGVDERPAFLDQARWLSEAWGCHLTYLEGENHYTIVDRLAQILPPN